MEKEENGRMISREQEEIRRSIIEQYKAYRRKRNLTQEELAAKMGIKRPNISRFESGQYNPTIDMLVKLADSMGLELEITLKERKGEVGEGEEK